jgi:hypothetical protein
MRFLWVACVLALPLGARAQSTTAGSGMCTGMMSGTIGLAVPQSDGTFLTIPSSQITTGVFGAAECQCSSVANNPNINAEIKLTTPFPLGTAATAEIWVGDTSCQTASTRNSSTNTGCKRIARPSIDQFTINSGAATGLHIPIPANTLINPAMDSCDIAVAGQQQSNGVFVFVFTDPNSPLATCTLTLSERLQPPDAPINPGASAGDGAVTVTWTPPSNTAFVPKKFQVLCSDACGNPITDNPPKQAYTVCANGVISRRSDLTSGGPSTGGTDGGVTSTDMGTMALRADVGGRLPTWANVATCDADAGTASSADGGIFEGTSAGPLTSLDPRFICSDELGPSASSTRITGLTNFQAYHFVVVAIDQYGNTTPSTRIDATPQPIDDLWQRYRRDGGQGSCFIATAAFGSYENRWVWVLRDFRDQVLLPRDWGKGFVEWYYAHSPGAAAWIGAHGWARGATRVALVPVIAGAWFWLYVPPWQKAFVLTLLFAFVLRKRIRAALRRGAAA